MNDREAVLQTELDTMQARLDEVALRYLLDAVKPVERREPSNNEQEIKP